MRWRAGVVAGVDSDGALLIEDPTGAQHRVHSGELLAA
jgi:biotin-(acetyl-CoA carboxylase) ligase